MEYKTANGRKRFRLDQRAKPKRSRAVDDQAPSGRTAQPPLRPCGPTYLDVQETARLTRLSPVTLSRMRQVGTGPAFIKASRRVLYKLDDVIEWLEAGRRTSTSDERRRAWRR